jgi:DNA-binding CsgD family transcriptional regulator
MAAPGGRHLPVGREDVASALTVRELEALQLIVEGLSNAEIAAAMVITPETVKTYVPRILTKLDLHDRVQAIVLAYRIGLPTGSAWYPPRPEPARPQEAVTTIFFPACNPFSRWRCASTTVSRENTLS